MAKTSIVARENKRTKLRARFRSKYEQLKKAIRDPKLSVEDRWLMQRKLQALPLNASPVRKRNRCELTGRPRGVYRRFGLARSMLRIYAMRGEIPGLVKSSW